MLPRKHATFLVLPFLIMISAKAAMGQSTAFTYQGRLTDSATPANGNYDLQFALWDSLSNGNQVGSTQTLSTVAVSSGIFTVQLDFGASAFPGANRWLEISARPSGGGAFTLLTPRQQITPTPYAVRSLNASSADAVLVGGVPSGSGNYIQNSTSQQAGANLNISGNGTAGGTFNGNVVNATTQYTLGGSRVLSAPGTANLFVGSGTGQANTGFDNSFFGPGAGQSNTTGSINSFFGKDAGTSNKTGNHNSFFGEGAGHDTTTGDQNSFVGDGAGFANTTGYENSFFSSLSGQNNTTGFKNLFVGGDAGFTNQTGSLNTIIGYLSDVGADGLTNATALGANAQVNQSNSLVLGSIAGINSATTTVNVGIGTATPGSRLEVNGGVVITPGGAGGKIQFGTPNAETGLTITGTNRADVRFDGSTLKLLAGNGTTSPASGIAINTSGNVGIGTFSPLLGVKLDLVGGFLRVDQFAGGGDEQVCRNSSFHTIATCGSSLRYKKQIAPYSAGLDLINRLRPITFAWKDSGRRDLGLGAEDVAKVEPLLVTRNDQGEVEGVKYDHLNVVLINAIKQQQEQIETLQQTNAALSLRLQRIEKTLHRIGSRQNLRHSLRRK